MGLLDAARGPERVYLTSITFGEDTLAVGASSQSDFD
jgi:hypothetical protein